MMHGVIFIWGFTGVIGKKLEHLDAEVIVVYRTLIGFLTLGAVMLLTRRKVSFNKKTFLKVCGVGVLIAAHWVTFFQSIHYSNVSYALIFFSTTALFTSFLEPLLMKKRFKPIELIMGVIVILGILIIALNSTPEQTQGSTPKNFNLGMLCAIISAFLAALFSVINAQLVAKNDAVPITFIELIVGCLVTFVGVIIYYALGTDLPLYETITMQFSISISDFIWLFVLGSICTAFAFFMGIYLMKFITPFTMNLSVNMEPIYAMIIAVMWFKGSEVMEPLFYLGAAIIIGAVVMNAYLKKAQKKKISS